MNNLTYRWATKLIARLKETLSKYKQDRAMQNFEFQ